MRGEAKIRVHIPVAVMIFEEIDVVVVCVVINAAFVLQLSSIFDQMS
jgi:hypothetical protein